MSLDKLLIFTDLLHKFRTIERRVLVRNSERRENDIEHSYLISDGVLIIQQEGINDFIRFVNNANRPGVTP